MMNRVLLINKTKSPSRDQLTSCERSAGEILFSRFPKLTFAGYVIVEGTGKKAANWIIDDQDVAAFHEFARTVSSPTHEVAVFHKGINKFGGQCEQRII